LLDGLAQQIAAAHPECAAGLLRRFVDAVLPRCLSTAKLFDGCGADLGHVI
jgi:hypothetical protein